MSTCTYTVNDKGIAVMTINNPPMNALAGSVIQDIKKAVEDAIADDSARVVIFTGEGAAFIAGADLKEVAQSTPEESVDYLAKGQEVFSIIENCDKPFIAAINGFCLGGGLEFAMACHMRLADEKAKFGLPESSLGMMPGFGGTQRAPKLAGKARALEVILSADMISADRAAQYGLINRAVPAGTVMEEAMKLAGSIARKGRPAVKAIFKVINEGLEMPMDKGQELERNLVGELRKTENNKEGITAFLEKRKPATMDN